MKVEAVERRPQSLQPSAARAAEPWPVDAGGELARRVVRAQLGSASAFEELVQEFGPRLYRLLVVRLSGDRDARDVLQETLLGAWQGLPRLRRPERFWPWLVGIAANKATDVVRRRPPGGEPTAADQPVSDSSTALETREALDALPDHLRDVVLLRYVLRLSEEEAAEALGVRVGTVKSRTARARKRLGELLGRE